MATAAASRADEEKLKALNDRLGQIRAQAAESRHASFANSLRNCEVCAPSSKRAAVYCVNCEVRFCSNCDRFHQLGALTKHKTIPYNWRDQAPTLGRCQVHGNPETEYCEFCNRMVCDECASSTEHENHYAGAVEGEDVAVRQKRMLKEQVYLLKYKVGNAPNFLRMRLTKTLDDQLKHLVEKILRAEFDSLHQMLDEREKELSTEIYGWKDHFMPSIMQACRRMEDENKGDMDLVHEGEYILQQDNAFILEGTRTAQLLESIQEANRRDNVLKTKALLRSIDLSQHRAFKVDAVKRALNRVYIARGEGVTITDEGGAPRPGTAGSSFDAPLDVSQLSFSRATVSISFKCAVALWDRKFSAATSIGTGEQMKYLVRELHTQMVRGHGVPDQYTIELFEDYDKSAPNRRQLELDVVDELHGVFEDMFSKWPQIHEELKLRVDPLKTGKVGRQEFVIAWSMYVEREIVAAVRVLASHMQSSQQQHQQKQRLAATGARFLPDLSTAH